MVYYLNDDLKKTGTTYFTIKGARHTREYTVQRERRQEYAVYEDVLSEEDVPEYEAFELSKEANCVTRSLAMYMRHVEEQLDILSSYTLMEEEISFLSLPLTLDTKKNTGVFLYIYNLDEFNYQEIYNEALKAVIIPQTIDAWLLSFDHSIGLEVVKQKIEQRFNCRIETYKPYAKYDMTYTDNDTVEQLIEAYEASLVFGDETTQLLRVLAANKYKYTVWTLNQSIIDLTYKARKEISAIQLPNNFNWAPAINLENRLLECNIWEHLSVSSRILVVKGLLNCIETTAEYFNISKYLAWRLVVLNLQLKGCTAYYLVSANEFVKLYAISGGNLLYLCAEHLMVFDCQDFIKHAKDVFYCICSSNEGTIFKDGEFYERTLYPDRIGEEWVIEHIDDFNEIEFTIQLLVNELTDIGDKSNKLYYIIDLTIYSNYDEGFIAKLESRILKYGSIGNNLYNSEDENSDELYLPPQPSWKSLKGLLEAIKKRIEDLRQYKVANINVLEEA